jgi:hypothetical protein
MIANEHNEHAQVVSRTLDTHIKTWTQSTLPGPTNLLRDGSVGPVHTLQRILSKLNVIGE